MYDLHKTMQTGEWIHLPRGSPWGFEWYSQRLDVSSKMLNICLIIQILCLVYTVQPLSLPL